MWIKMRPIELATIVLRASIFGLLKFCDFSWRELNKGIVYDVRCPAQNFYVSPYAMARAPLYRLRLAERQV